MNDNEKKVFAEFKEFLSHKSSVPQELSQKILESIRRELTPTAVFVFSKIFVVHLVIGTLSLAVCDQFGINPFNTGFSLTEYFMTFGHSVCMMLCGFLFLSLTTVFSKVVLNRNEFIVLKNNTFIQVFFLSLLSLIFFLLLGAKIVFSAAAFWLIGALLGGVAIIQLIGNMNGLARSPRL